ncbi:Oidioi.mRNA.OKI2018_I69.XSR.g15970.t1.cds [Oikopleura dioica]|uniref:Oidioi.mRNA.OKI2018_I69.XSR.g15970.t1.cds n=1 Tax=Oikopleura dioica TaxID=34765 RepID=A0ABN7SGG7_OIKDI|nr:Oidioi.mRNA.OKI2018_I69.XSR.g15970.t1.cds [Oikopleura dioica]
MKPERKHFHRVHPRKEKVERVLQLFQRTAKKRHEAKRLGIIPYLDGWEELVDKKLKEEEEQKKAKEILAQTISDKKDIEENLLTAKSTETNTEEHIQLSDEKIEKWLSRCKGDGAKKT